MDQNKKPSNARPILSCEVTKQKGYFFLVFSYSLGHDENSHFTLAPGLASGQGQWRGMLPCAITTICGGDKMGNRVLMCHPIPSPSHPIPMTFTMERQACWEKSPRKNCQQAFARKRLLGPLETALRKGRSPMGHTKRDTFGNSNRGEEEGGGYSLLLIY